MRFLEDVKARPRELSVVKRIITMRGNGMGGSPGDVSENPVTLEKRKKGWRMSCDVGEATEGSANEL